ncbi:MAG: NAD(P)-dependent oxidoreductase [Planctomycetaceae bacterium]|nr:NAD(P)-dependent oxidoreductase [Planctomycetaceae bacterium]
MTKLKVFVTGGSGIVGHYVIDELYKQGHTVVNADKVPLTNDLRHSGTTGQYASASAAVGLRINWPRIPNFFEVDVTDYGQVISAMDGCDAVIALASRPSASCYVEEDVVRTNTMSMWNICRAAEQLMIHQLVLGSSYNAIGAMGTAQRWEANQVKPPEYFPLDQHSTTRAEDPYSISKWLGEEIGDAFARRNPQMALASMRFNGMWDDQYFEQLRANPISDAWTRCQGFWTYVHIRDAARACVVAITNRNWLGHHRFFINAEDTMLAIPTLEALATVYPDVPLNTTMPEFTSPISTQYVTDIIGWKPEYSWRQ